MGDFLFFVFCGENFLKRKLFHTPLSKNLKQGYGIYFCFGCSTFDKQKLIYWLLIRFASLNTFSHRRRLIDLWLSIIDCYDSVIRRIIYISLLQRVAKRHEGLRKQLSVVFPRVWPSRSETAGAERDWWGVAIIDGVIFLLVLYQKHGCFASYTSSVT